MHSDNGTQFLGAIRQMKKDLENWLGQAVYQHLADHGTQWKFIIIVGGCREVYEEAFDEGDWTTSVHLQLIGDSTGED